MKKMICLVLFSTMNTFAQMTDSETSDNSHIKSGNLSSYALNKIITLATGFAASLFQE